MRVCALPTSLPPCPLPAYPFQACGSTAIINYAPTIFANVGVEVDEAVILSAALGAIKLLGIIICFFMVDSCGRRPLFV